MIFSERTARRAYRASWYIALTLELTICAFGQIALWGDASVGASTLALIGSGITIVIGHTMRRDAHAQLQDDGRRRDSTVTTALIAAVLTATTVQILTDWTLPLT